MVGENPKLAGGRMAPELSSRTQRARAVMELKLSVLSALNKLGDRDTQQMAGDELHRIAESLSPESVSVFLSALYEVGTEHKVYARRECVRVIATLAASHAEALPNHLQKMLAFLVRRLKDPDSQIRDACVETVGLLVSKVPLPPHSAGGDNSSTHQQQQQQQQQQSVVIVYAKPFFDAMNEQTKSVQVGAAMCLAKIIENAPDISSGCVHRLATRIIKFVSHPGFLAKAALLAVIGSLARTVKGTSGEHLIQLVPCVQEALQSSDWNARKASAEALSALASPGMSKAKPSTVSVLESLRFDKVKPVRDAVTVALQLWKAVPGPETENGVKFVPKNSTQDETPSFSRCWKEADNSSTSAAETNDSVEKAESILSDDKSSSKSSRRRVAPVVSDLKMNPEFFRKIENKNLDDWEVEVAVPRVSPTDSKTDDETKGVPEGKGSGETIEETFASSYTIKASLEETSSWLKTSLEGQRSGSSPVEGHRSSPSNRSSPVNNHRSTSNDGRRHSPNEDHKRSPTDTYRSSTAHEWVIMQRQIYQLERGQTELLETLQEFMCSIQNNMQALQDRMQWLEKSVEALSSNRSTGSSRNTSTDTNHIRTREPSRMSKFYEAEEEARSGRSSPYEPRAANWGMAPSSSLRGTGAAGGMQISPRSSGSPFSTRQPEEDDDVENEPHNNGRRAWERSSRHGEGPSARSVWRASKDEATLEAIRGAAGDELQQAQSDLGKLDKEEVEGEERTTSGQTPSWLRWSRAMDNLHAGEVDLAYDDALAAEDDLLLMRLMNQTGPAFDQLTSSTAVAMFRALAQIFQQQHVLDSAFPWLQQVADLIRAKGAEFWSFSMEEKRDIVSLLHDASALDFPERWMGNMVAKLALQLSAAWDMDLLLS